MEEHSKKNWSKISLPLFEKSKTIGILSVIKLADNIEIYTKAITIFII